MQLQAEKDISGQHTYPRGIRRVRFEAAFEPDVGPPQAVETRLQLLARFVVAEERRHRELLQQLVLQMSAQRQVFQKQMSTWTLPPD